MNQDSIHIAEKFDEIRHRLIYIVDSNDIASPEDFTFVRKYLQDKKSKYHIRYQVRCPSSNCDTLLMSPLLSQARYLIKEHLIKKHPYICLHGKKKSISCDCFKLLHGNKKIYNCRKNRKIYIHNTLQSQLKTPINFRNTINYVSLREEEKLAVETLLTLREIHKE